MARFGPLAGQNVKVVASDAKIVPSAEVLAVSDGPLALSEIILAVCAAVPGKPTLNATASTRKVQLSWNVVSNALQYDVLRNETGPDAGYILIKTVGGTTFTDFEVMNTITYYYRIQGVSVVNGERTCWGPVSDAKAIAPQPAPAYTISGTITDKFSGAPREGFGTTAKDASGHTWAYGYTKGSGSYVLYEIPNGSYTVRPSKKCYSFFPPYAGVTVSGANPPNISFQAVGPSSFCTQCFDAYFADNNACSKWNIEQQPKCFAELRAILQVCLDRATAQADSALNGAVLLSVVTARAYGQPQTETWPFVVTEAGDYFVNVVNGDQYYTETKVSSATIDLSPGGRVVAPSDLNKNVNLVVKPVHLEPGEYTLEIEVRSQPGSYLTVVLSDRDFSAFEALP